MQEIGLVAGQTVPCIEILQDRLLSRNEQVGNNENEYKREFFQDHLNKFRI
jgi:hypothetical protein